MGIVIADGLSSSFPPSILLWKHGYFHSLMMERCFFVHISNVKCAYFRGEVADTKHEPLIVTIGIGVVMSQQVILVRMFIRYEYMWQVAWLKRWIKWQLRLGLINLRIDIVVHLIVAIEWRTQSNFPWCHLFLCFPGTMVDALVCRLAEYLLDELTIPVKFMFYRLFCNLFDMWSSGLLFLLRNIQFRR